MKTAECWNCGATGVLKGEHGHALVCGGCLGSGSRQTVLDDFPSFSGRKICDGVLTVSFSTESWAHLHLAREEHPQAPPPVGTIIAITYQEFLAGAMPCRAE